MLNSITNKNLKELLSKKRLTEELLMEFKTSFFIHPSKEAEEGFFEFTYESDGEIIYLFTSADEYMECFADNTEVTPECVYLNQLKTAVYDAFRGVVINPSSDSFFIPKTFLRHIILDIDRNNEIYEDYILPPKPFRDNRLLHDYCRGKKTFKFYANLFDYLDASTLYTLVVSDDCLDEYFKDDKLCIGEVDCSFYKINNHYVLFSDVELLTDETKDLPGYFYYLIGDAVDLARLSFEFDYEGIILKTPEGDFTLPRNLLLRHYEKIIEKYRKRENAHKFAFKVEE